MIAVKSYYSLRYGVASVEELVSQAGAYGMEYLCLSDINNTTGIVEHMKHCYENDIKPIAGIEFRNKDNWLYTGIAKNHNGFHQLNQFLSHYRLNNIKLPYRPPAMEDVIFVFPYGVIDPSELMSYEYIGVRMADLNKIVGKEYPAYKNKLMMFHSVVFSRKDQYDMHRHLRAIDHNSLLSQVREEWLASASEFFYHPIDLENRYQDYPELLENAAMVKAIPGLDFGNDIKNKKTFTGSREKDRMLLRKLAFEGMEQRYGLEAHIAGERVSKELEIIEKLGFGAYFLITRDIIRYSMQRGFYHVGRGSGANSVVAYCLYITDVDPIELNLYFERFINPKRSSPPDFDIDYSWKERDEVLNYIFHTYPGGHTALLGALSTFRGKSIIRELGKVYGLPKSEIDEMIAHSRRHINQDGTVDKIFHLAEQLTDFPNLRTIHAGGILISEKPVTSYTALDLPPKGYPTTQWDMYSAEDLGFEKLDILSQRGIGHIRDSVELVRENCYVQIDIHDVDTIKSDVKTKALLRSGETTGCFYIESPAMRGLLKKLQCDNYLTLVAASSIIRPGVAKSGMMKEYIRRFHHPDGFDYIHPIMKEQLGETYGVMVYQEDVLKVCHHFAGLDMADADILRRAMSGKFRSHKEFERIEHKFFSNCRGRGYPETIIQEVWRQIESFAGYSFSKAHSASYAVESFQSLYLKAHFPLEFLTSVINNFGGFYHTWVYINEAKRYGAHIHLPCLNHSGYLTRIIKDNIYLGFIHIKELESATSKRIVQERGKNGPFEDLEDFIYRIPLSRQQIILLIRVGALRFVEATKAELLWKAHFLKGKRKEKTDVQSMFKTHSQKFELPAFEQTDLEDAYDEIELLGFPVSLSLFDLLKTSFRGEVYARNLKQFVGKKKKLVGRLVTIKYVRTVKGDIMKFAAFTDVYGEFFDTVHFPDSLKNYPFKGHGVYLILGKIVEEFGFPSVEVDKMAKLPLKADPRET